MVIYPLLFSFIAGVVSFAGASYVMAHYRASYGPTEIRAALAIGIGAFTPFIMIFIGPQVFRGKAEQDVAGGVIIVVSAITIVAVATILGSRTSPR
jgi:hypothetical protein